MPHKVKTPEVTVNQGQTIDSLHLILCCAIKVLHFLTIYLMMNAALSLIEFHINMMYDQHSTHLETCAYIVVITFLHVRVVDELTSTVHDIV